MKRVLLNHTPTIHLRVLLNRAPSSTQLHPPPPSSFQPPPSFLQHPQQYLNQNIARYWAISPNLGRKIKNVCFNWKMAHLVYWRCFWNFDLKIHIWANLGPKIQSCLFCLKIGAHSISRMLIPNPDLDFWNFDPKIYFWANLGQKCQSFSFCLKIDTHVLSRLLILVPTLIFWISKLKSIFGQVVVYFDWQLTHMVYWGCWFLFWQ